MTPYTSVRAILRDLPPRSKFRFAADQPGTVRHLLGHGYQLTPRKEAERLTTMELGTRVVPLGTLS